MNREDLNAKIKHPETEVTFIKMPHCKVEKIYYLLMHTIEMGETYEIS